MNNLDLLVFFNLFILPWMVIVFVLFKFVKFLSYDRKDMFPFKNKKKRTNKDFKFYLAFWFQRRSFQTLVRILRDLFLLYGIIIISVFFDIIFSFGGISYTWYNIVPEVCMNIRSIFEIYKGGTLFQIFYFDYYFGNFISNIINILNGFCEALENSCIDLLAFHTSDDFFGSVDSSTIIAERPLIYFSGGDDKVKVVINRNNGYTLENQIYSKSNIFINKNNDLDDVRNIVWQIKYIPYASDFIGKNGNGNDEDILKEFLNEYDSKRRLLSLQGRLPEYFRTKLNVRVVEGGSIGGEGYRLSDPRDFLQAMKQDLENARRRMGWCEYVLRGFIVSDFKAWVIERCFPRNGVNQIHETDYKRFSDSYYKYSAKVNPMIQYLYDIISLRDEKGRVMVEKVEDMLKKCQDLGRFYELRYKVYYDNYLVGRAIDILSTKNDIEDNKTEFDVLLNRFMNPDVISEEFGDPKCTFNYYKFNAELNRSAVSNFQANGRSIDYFLRTGKEVSLRRFLKNKGTGLLSYNFKGVDAGHPVVAVHEKVFYENTHYKNFKFVERKKFSLADMGYNYYCVSSQGHSGFWNNIYFVNFFGRFGMMPSDFPSSWLHDELIRKLFNNKLAVPHIFDIFRFKYEMVSVPGGDSFEFEQGLLRENADPEDFVRAGLPDRVYHYGMEPYKILMRQEYLIRFLEVFKSLLGDQVLLNQAIGNDGNGRGAPYNIFMMNNFKFNGGCQSVQDLYDTQNIRNSVIYKFVHLLYGDLFFCHIGNKIPEDDITGVNRLFNDRSLDFGEFRQRLRLYAYNHVTNFYQMTSNLRKFYMCNAMSNKNSGVKLTADEICNGVICKMPVYELKPHDINLDKNKKDDFVQKQLDVSASIDFHYHGKVVGAVIKHAVIDKKMTGMDVSVDSFLKSHIMDVSIDYNYFPAVNRYSMPYSSKSLIKCLDSSAAKPTYMDEWYNVHCRHRNLLDLSRGIYCRKAVTRMRFEIDQNFLKNLGFKTDKHIIYERFEERLFSRFIGKRDRGYF